MKRYSNVDNFKQQSGKKIHFYPQASPGNESQYTIFVLKLIYIIFTSTSKRDYISHSISYLTTMFSHAEDIEAINRMIY